MSTAADFKATLKSRVEAVTLQPDTPPEEARAAVLAALASIEVTPDDTIEGLKARIRARIESMTLNKSLQENFEELRTAFRDIYAMVMSDGQKDRINN